MMASHSRSSAGSSPHSLFEPFRSAFSPTVRSSTSVIADQCMADEEIASMIGEAPDHDGFVEWTINVELRNVLADRDGRPIIMADVGVIPINRASTWAGSKACPPLDHRRTAAYTSRSGTPCSRAMRAQSSYSGVTTSKPSVASRAWPSPAPTASRTVTASRCSFERSAVCGECRTSPSRGRGSLPVPRPSLVRRSPTACTPGRFFFICIGIDEHVQRPGRE